jgi:threonine dehydratase
VGHLLKTLPTLTDIKEAAQRIKPFIHRTPVLTCAGINDITDAALFFKCENLQKVGAFKFRGACNAVFSLSAQEAQNGVATHSSGNHAAAIALAAKLHGIKSYIVMPENSAEIKKKAVESYGGEIFYCANNLPAREKTLNKIVADRGAAFIHPYNDYRIITGQATAGLEMLEDVTDLDIMITPVSGGGLISGTALTIHYLSPKTKVIGAEPTGADDAFRSLQSGTLQPSDHPQTICDGLRAALGILTFPIIQKYVSQIVRVSDEFTIKAMRLIWERMKIIVEPSAAITLGALLADTIAVKGKRVGIILSGGNADLDALPW